MSKQTFYVLLAGRVLAGSVIVLAVLELTSGLSYVVQMAIDIVTFGIVYVLFWAPPYKFENADYGSDSSS